MRDAETGSYQEPVCCDKESDKEGIQAVPDSD
jgi:hypothetical protein